MSVSTSLSDALLVSSTNPAATTGGVSMMTDCGDKGTGSGAVAVSSLVVLDERSTRCTVSGVSATLDFDLREVTRWNSGMPIFSLLAVLTGCCGSCGSCEKGEDSAGADAAICAAA